jgi:catechol 2,3-dioxygenase-like lactoylglutathione lyase family enzyme
MVQLNHTIVWARDARGSAEFLAELLGLPAPITFYRFEVVTLANGVSLDFMNRAEPIDGQHYAFLVDDEEFDRGIAFVARKGLTFWADPGQRQAGEINRNDGGRGVYFENPDGHLLELITKPYGSD